MDFSFSAATEDAITLAPPALLRGPAAPDRPPGPGKLAVVAGGLRATFAEFDTAVNRCAHALAERGLAKGDRLALLSHNCFEYAVLAFATARLGVVLVPVNFMLTADEVAYILRHSGAKGIVTEDTLAGTAAKALDGAGVAEPVRGWIDLSGTPAAAGWDDVATWWSQGPGDSQTCRWATTIR